MLALALAAVALSSPGTIVYWNDDPQPSIWAVQVNGSGSHRLLGNGQNAKRPRLSPDRQSIAFDGAPPGKPPLSDFDIQVVGLDGRGLRPVTSTAAWDTDAQWSPDGRWLSFTRTPPHPQGCRDAAVWIVHPDGTGARRVVAGCGARWSPDGRRLALSSPSGALQVVTVASRAVQTLRAGTAFLQPNGWARDGTLLVTSFAGNSATMSLVRGGVSRKLGAGFGACFSPDGRRVLYTRSFMGPLYAVGRDGRHRRRIGSVVAAEPDWR